MNQFTNILKNRRVHYAVFLLLFVGVTLHTFHSQGISLDYKSEDPQRYFHVYASTIDTIQSNKVVTDVRITRCVRGFTCSEPRDGLAPGWWEKMPSKLNLFQEGTSLFNYYMYVKKAKGNEARHFLVDITFTYSLEPPSTGLEGSKWKLQKVTSKAYMWINYFDSLEYHVPIVRDLNVLYGKQDLVDYRPHWKFESASVILPVKQTIHCTISTLRIPVNQEIAILKAEQEFDLVLKKNGIFVTSDESVKIIQISDLHIGQDTGVCRESCKFDQVTLNFLSEVLEAEKGTKLVVITGDMIDFHRSLHYESVILKALAPILKAQIPFVFVFGDSDYDRSRHFSRDSVMDFISSLPGCYNNRMRDLDRRIYGLTNGNIKIFRVPELNSQESPDYNSLDLSNPKAMVTYLDSLHNKIDESQANYLYRINHNLNKEVQEKLLFFHHPLPNFRPSGTVKIIGSYNEKHKFWSPTDHKILDDIKSAGYKAVGVGHEHGNDACIWDETDGKKILLCYSGVTGESAITPLDVTRRLRVFQLDLEKERIYSWKRDSEKQFDPQEIWSAASDDTQ